MQCKRWQQLKTLKIYLKAKKYTLLNYVLTTPVGVVIRGYVLGSRKNFQDMLRYDDEKLHPNGTTLYEWNSHSQQYKKNYQRI